MKNKKIINSLLFLFCLAMPLTSCKGGNTSSLVNSSLSSSSQTITSSSSSSQTITSSSSSSQTITSPITSSSSTSTGEENDGTITIAEAIQIAMESGETLTENEYQISGIITDVSNAMYGEMTIKDDTGSLYIYGTYDKDRTTRYDMMSDRPVKGDKVTLLGKLKTYKNTPEMDRGYIQSFEHLIPEYDESQYEEKSIKEARLVADDEKVKITGKVAAITYADGLKPNGFYLVDSESSIYVYDSNVAQQVEKGNEITIAAVKDYYVLSTEASAAEKHGYKGSNQLKEAVLINNDKKVNEIDYSWCDEITVKELMETPVTEDITSLIYKTNALVEKVEGKGFVNYYLYDIDGKTGNYTYTQAGGDDFTWLDKYDGKICTVYMAAHNAKSSSTDCFFRFIPVEVKDENYEFDLTKSCEFALEYYANDQFKSVYKADPQLKVVTEISNDLIGIQQVDFEYTSSNTNSLYFAQEGDDLVMHTNEPGEVEITITAKYQTLTAESKINVTVEETVIASGVTVQEAVEAEVGTVVQVEGIVSSSLVNQDGFYIVDETGILAIKTTTDNLKDIHQGDKVVVKGTRINYQGSKGNKECNIGQICINDAEIVANYYGNNEYSTASFKEATLEELLALDTLEHHTHEAYIVTATINFEDYTYYSMYSIKDGSSSMNLYCANGDQYSFLKPYSGQKVKMEIALCNWSNKDVFPGCVISIILEDGTKVYNELNLAK